MWVCLNHSFNSIFALEAESNHSIRYRSTARFGFQELLCFVAAFFSPQKVLERESLTANVLVVILLFNFYIKVLFYKIVCQTTVLIMTFMKNKLLSVLRAHFSLDAFINHLIYYLFINEYLVRCFHSLSIKWWAELATHLRLWN